MSDDTDNGPFNTMKGYRDKVFGRANQPQACDSDSRVDRYSTCSMSMSMAGTKGLLNPSGSNNCFLNSAVQGIFAFNQLVPRKETADEKQQCSEIIKYKNLQTNLLNVVLWHLDVFRRNFRNVSEHACSQRSCIFCALKIIFTQFQFNSEEVLPPDALREALAKAFEDEQRFQLGLMDDAAECFENILLRLHLHLCNGISDEACDQRHCITHQKFAMVLVEQLVCGCGSTSEPFSFVQLIQYLSTNSLVSTYQKTLHDSRQNRFGCLVKSALKDGSIEAPCPMKKCNKKSLVKRTLMSAPDVMCVGLIWDSDQPSLEHIEQVVKSIGVEIILEDMFDEVADERDSVRHRRYNLVGVVCYYGKHYSTFFYNSSQSSWISCDDASVTQIGSDWEEVKKKCVRGRYQPLLLIYQNNNATSMTMDTAPKSTTILRNLDHKTKAAPAADSAISGPMSIKQQSRSSLLDKPGIKGTRITDAYTTSQQQEPTSPLIDLNSPQALQSNRNPLYHNPGLYPVNSAYPPQNWNRPVTFAPVGPQPNPYRFGVIRLVPSTAPNTHTQMYSVVDPRQVGSQSSYPVVSGISQPPVNTQMNVDERNYYPGTTSANQRVTGQHNDGSGNRNNNGMSNGVRMIYDSSQQQTGLNQHPVSQRIPLQPQLQQPMEIQNPQQARLMLQQSQQPQAHTQQQLHQPWTQQLIQQSQAQRLIQSQPQQPILPTQSQQPIQPAQPQQLMQLPQTQQRIQGPQAQLLMQQPQGQQMMQQPPSQLPLQQHQITPPMQQPQAQPVIRVQANPAQFQNSQQMMYQQYNVPQHQMAQGLPQSMNMNGPEVDAWLEQKKIELERKKLESRMDYMNSVREIASSDGLVMPVPQVNNVNNVLSGGHYTQLSAVGAKMVNPAIINSNLKPVDKIFVSGQNVVPLSASYTDGLAVTSVRTQESKPNFVYTVADNSHQDSQVINKPRSNLQQVYSGSLQNLSSESCGAYIVKPNVVNKQQLNNRVNGPYTASSAHQPYSNQGTNISDRTENVGSRVNAAKDKGLENGAVQRSDFKNAHLPIRSDGSPTFGTTLYSRDMHTPVSDISMSDWCIVEKMEDCSVAGNQTTGQNVRAGKQIMQESMISGFDYVTDASELYPRADGKDVKNSQNGKSNEKLDGSRKIINSSPKRESAMLRLNHSFDESQLLAMRNESDLIQLNEQLPAVKNQLFMEQVQQLYAAPRPPAPRRQQPPGVVVVHPTAVIKLNPVNPAARPNK